jgi:hypothetical protein
VTESIYSRAPDVVWRLGPDRVLVRRIGGGEEAALDLMGYMSHLWLALDEPATLAILNSRLAEAGIAPVPPAAASELLSSGCLQTQEEAC